MATVSIIFGVRPIVRVRGEDIRLNQLSSQAQAHGALASILGLSLAWQRYYNSPRPRLTPTRSRLQTCMDLCLMTDQIEVKVTQADIDRGRPEILECPVANAINRTLQDAGINGYSAAVGCSSAGEGKSCYSLVPTDAFYGYSDEYDEDQVLDNARDVELPTVVSSCVLAFCRAWWDRTLKIPPARDWPAFQVRLP